jgi:hypothetical protein
MQVYGMGRPAFRPLGPIGVSALLPARRTGSTPAWPSAPALGASGLGLGVHVTPAAEDRGSDDGLCLSGLPPVRVRNTRMR